MKHALIALSLLGLGGCFTTPEPAAVGTTGSGAATPVVARTTSTETCVKPLLKAPRLCTDFGRFDIKSDIVKSDQHGVYRSTALWSPNWNVRGGIFVRDPIPGRTLAEYAQEFMEDDLRGYSEGITPEEVERNIEGGAVITYRFRFPAHGRMDYVLGYREIGEGPNKKWVMYRTANFSRLEQQENDALAILLSARIPDV